MSEATILSKTKHIYYADVADEAGNRAKVMTGVITIDSAGATTANLNPNFTADIRTLDIVSIQGEDGYIVQYEYSTADIKIMQADAADSATAKALAETTTSTLTGLNFRYMVWGY